MTFDAELDEFKRCIDLRQYAVSLGYEVDHKVTGRSEKVRSGRSATVMRRGADKISVRVLDSGHWGYYSWRDDQDKGSIIEFVQRRKSLNLGHVRKELRPWVGCSSSGPLPATSRIDDTRKDRRRIITTLGRMQIAKRHPYLEDRSISRELLGSDRFEGQIRIDWRGNAIFPHVDSEGLCGYEIKNRDLKGGRFSAGGTKTLWTSRNQPDDDQLVISEGAIDALSHAVLFPRRRARYASTGGKMSELQQKLVRAAIAEMPLNSEIVAAMDADAAGREHADMVREAFDSVGRSDLRFRYHAPFVGKDWNDALRAAMSQCSVNER